MSEYDGSRGVRPYNRSHRLPHTPPSTTLLLVASPGGALADVLQLSGMRTHEIF